MFLFPSFTADSQASLGFLTVMDSRIRLVSSKYSPLLTSPIPKRKSGKDKRKGKIMNTQSITTSFPSTSPHFEQSQFSNFKGDKIMKRSFYILFGGISFAWLACMMILVASML